MLNLIIIIGLFTKLYAHKSMTKAELTSLKTSPALRSATIETIVDTIYTDAVMAASKGKPGYRWLNPGITFDKEMGFDIKSNLEKLFPDSNIVYMYPTRNEFDIYWN